ncbi:MAG: GIY-YIG nuclease family protein [Clostridia bacterium]|nr:GIY-YIG nuclease family protein [Clostridia bacterium]
MSNIVEQNINFREEKPYYIYIHTCPNLKTYVGLTQNPKVRWDNGEGYKNNEDFYEAILRYGWNNIKHEIVAETYYRWVAQRIEKTLITKYSRKGKSYNILNEFKEDYKSKRKIPLKKVGKYSKDGNLIKVYSSAAEAEREGNTNRDNIQACCRGTLKSAGGFVWKYL